MRFSSLSTVTLTAALASSVSAAAIPNGDTPAPKDCRALEGQERIDCLNYNYDNGFFNGHGFQNCTHEEIACHKGEYYVCDNGKWTNLGCSYGTTCYAYFDEDGIVVDADCEHPLSSSFSFSYSATSTSSTTSTSTSTATSTSKTSSSSSSSKTSSSSSSSKISSSTSTAASTSKTSTSASKTSTSTSSTSTSTSKTSSSSSKSTSSSSSKTSSSASKTSTSTSSTSTAAPSAAPEEKGLKITSIESVKPIKEGKEGPFELYWVNMTWELNNPRESETYFIPFEEMFNLPLDAHMTIMGKPNQPVLECEAYLAGLKCTAKAAGAYYKSLKGHMVVPVTFGRAKRQDSNVLKAKEWKFGANEITIANITTSVNFPKIKMVQDTRFKAAINNKNEIFFYFASDENPCTKTFSDVTVEYTISTKTSQQRIKPELSLVDKNDFDDFVYPIAPIEKMERFVDIRYSESKIEYGKGTSTNKRFVFTTVLTNYAGKQETPEIDFQLHASCSGMHGSPFGYSAVESTKVSLEHFKGTSVVSDYKLI